MVRDSRVRRHVVGSRLFMRILGPRANGMVHTFDALPVVGKPMVFLDRCVWRVEEAIVDGVEWYFDKMLVRENETVWNHWRRSR